jgi:hypothetical protein
MRIKFVKSEKLDLLSGAGLNLVGQILERHTMLRKDLNRQFIKQPHGMATGDVVTAYLLSLCTGKSDFEAVGKLYEHVMSPESVALKAFPSPVTVRQRIDEGADLYLPYVQKAAVDVLLSAKAPVTPLSTGHVALDVDVTPMDNSNTKKEGIGWTYKQVVGYAPIAGYLGQEGWCLGFELREGTQHCQKDTPDYLRRVIQAARRVTGLKLLVRLDGGNDALENYALFQEAGVDFLAKHNWRREDPTIWEEKARALPESAWTEPRKGKRVARLTEACERLHKEGEREVLVKYRMVVEVAERTIDRKGNVLLLPLTEVTAWITSLNLDEATIIGLYKDHGTSEQFHSEMKSELDLERLPSGKFVTNTLILELGALAYNVLPLMGQLGLNGYAQRHPTKRRRIRTVIQELLYVAARVVRSGHETFLQFGKRCGVFDRLLTLQARLCPT